MAKAVRDPSTGVTPQQERFACEFAKTGRPQLAYRRAYDAKAMTDKDCSTEASKLLHDDRVQARIEHYQRVAARRLEVSVERIAAQAARIAFLDVREMFDEDGRLLMPHELPTDIATAIDGIDVVEMQGGAKIALPAKDELEGQPNGGALKRSRKEVDSKKPEAEGPAMVHIPMYTKKVKFSRMEALKLLATWKKMLGDESGNDPFDLSKLTDEEFDKQFQAMKATVDMIERAKSRGTLVHAPKRLTQK